MQLLELIVDGVPGFPAAARMQLGSGHVVVVGQGDLASVILALLFPTGAARAALREGRATLVLGLPDGSSPTVEADFGEVAHSRLPTALSLPEVRTFEALCVLRRMKTAPRPPAMDEATLRGSLEGLQRELASCEQMERLESRLGELQHELFTWDDKLRQVREAEEKAREEVDRLRSFGEAEVPEDLGTKLESYEKALSRKEELEARLEEEFQALAGEAPTAQPLLRDLRFHLGWGFGLLFLVVALSSPWKPVALLSVPSFGVGAILALGSISRSQGGERRSRRSSYLEERKKKIHSSWEAESREVREAMVATSVDSVARLWKWLDEKETSRRNAENARQALETLRIHPEIASAREMRERISKEVERVENELSSLVAGSFRSAGEVRRDIQDLQRHMEELGTGREERGGDPSSALLDHATAILSVDRRELLQGLGPRASQLLAALTEGRWKSMGWGPSGGLACKGDAEIRGFQDLEHEDREAARAAFLFAMAERRGAGGQTLLLLDRPFDGLSPIMQELLARVLKWLGQQRVHILHRTDASIFLQAADAVVAPA